MNTWLPHEAVMSVGMVGYPGWGGWVLDAPLNAGCESITVKAKITTIS